MEWYASEVLDFNINEQDVLLIKVFAGGGKKKWVELRGISSEIIENYVLIRQRVG